MAQKLVVGSPLVPQGFIVPLVFGGLAGLIIGIRRDQLLAMNQNLGAEISEHRAARKALKESQERFKKLSNLSFEGILIHQNGLVLDVNESFLHMMGYSRAEIIGKNIIELIVPAEYLPIVQENLLKKNAAPYEVMARRKDGTLFPTEIEARDISEADGGYRVTAIRDITERKTAAQKLAILTTAVEQSPSTIVITDTSGSIEYVNPKFIALTGYSYSDAIGQNPSVLKSGDQSADFYKDLWATISSGEMWTGEFHNKKKNGELYWESARISPIVDDNGEIIHYLAIKEDITERKATEDALRQSESRLNRAQHMAHVGDWELEIETNTLSWSDEIYRIFGLKPQQNKPTYDAFVDGIHPNDKDYVLQTYADSLKNRTPFDIIHRLLLEDGSIKFVHEHCETIYDDVGEPLRSIGTIHDITQSKQAENESQASKEHYRIIFDCSPDPILIHDGKKILDVNTATLTAFALDDKTELIGKDPFSFVHPDDLNVSKKRYESLTNKSGTLEATEVRIITPTRGERIAIASPVAIMYNNQQAIMVNYHDITDRKQAESARIALEAQLQQSQKLETVGTMVGGIAHDFNNILQSMFLYIGIIQDHLPDDQKLQKSFQHIMDDAGRARDLVEQILTFSRKSEVKLIPQAIHEVILEALAFERASLPANIEIVQHVDVDGGKVLCDETQIHQIVLNLCNNAKHAMESSGGVLNVSLKQVDKPGVGGSDMTQCLELVISDTGHGIPGEIMDRIYDPFYTTKAIGQGTGLGLSVIHGIVEMMRAKITIVSEPEVGTQVKILMPLVVEDLANSNSSETDLLELAPMTVLLVDDETAIRAIGRETISRKGHVVDTASDGAQALELFTADPQKYDFIITDLSMPNMGGMELTRAIRETGSQVQIILTSGNLDTAEKNKFLKEGISGFIQKPWTVKEMLKMWKKLV